MHVEHLSKYEIYALRCTNWSITRQGVDPDRKKFISFIFFWDVIEKDIMPTHSTVPLIYSLLATNDIHTTAT